MASEKTKELIIDVARELFAKQGYEETTMNDIALASGKGRRTVYTYFKSREDIFLAVSQGEIARMSKRLRAVARKNISHEDKLAQIIFTHLSLAREVVRRNGSLRAEFFRNIWLVERARKEFDLTERELLTQILEDGIAKGVFDNIDVQIAVDLIHYSVKGLEIPYIYGRLGAEGLASSLPVVQRILHRSLTKL